MAYRDTMVCLAESYRDVGMGKDKEAYLHLIAEGEKPGIANQMGQMSGCALVVRGYLRIDGCTDKRVLAPYRSGSAIESLVQMARERKAWVKPGPVKQPQPGDIVLVGGDTLTDGGVEHVFVVTGLNADGTIRSVDGGQIDAAGLQVIRERTRIWKNHVGMPWDTPLKSNDPGARVAKGRRVQGWIDLEKLRGD